MATKGFTREWAAAFSECFNNHTKITTPPIKRGDYGKPPLPGGGLCPTVYSPVNVFRLNDDSSVITSAVRFYDLDKNPPQQEYFEEESRLFYVPSLEKLFVWITKFILYFSSKIPNQHKNVVITQSNQIA